MASLYKNSNGKWTAQVNVGGVRRSKTFPSHAEARQWANREENNRAAGSATPQHKLTVADLIRAHIENGHAMGRTKSITMEMLIAKFGRVRLSNLTTKAVLDFIKARRAEPSEPGPATLNGDLTMLTTAISHGSAALDIDVAGALAAISRARMVLTKSGTISRSAERSRRPTHDELVAMHDFIMKDHRRHHLWDVIQFAICTAMRLGEICSIRHGDVDYDGRTIMVAARKHPDPAKKALNDQVVPVLVGHFKWDGEPVDALDIVRQQRKIRGDDRIFPHEARSISALFRKTARRCGIDDLRFHDLRHDGTSRLVEANLPLASVRLVTGHRSLSMLSRYVNLRPEDVAHVKLG